MKIIRKGSKETEYCCTCKQCKTKISFYRKEAELIWDDRDGDYLSIKCPTCDEEVTTYP